MQLNLEHLEFEHQAHHCSCSISPVMISVTSLVEPPGRVHFEIGLFVCLIT